MCIHTFAIGMLLSIPLMAHGAASTRAEHKNEAKNRALGKRPHHVHTFAAYSDYDHSRDNAVLDYSRGDSAGLSKSASVMVEHRTPRQSQPAWEACDPDMRKRIPRPDFSTGSTSHDWTDDERDSVHDGGKKRRTSFLHKLSPLSSRAH